MDPFVEEPEREAEEPAVANPWDHYARYPVLYDPLRRRLARALGLAEDATWDEVHAAEAQAAGLAAEPGHEEP